MAPAKETIDDKLTSKKKIFLYGVQSTYTTFVDYDQHIGHPCYKVNIIDVRFKEWVDLSRL